MTQPTVSKHWRKSLAKSKNVALTCRPVTRRPVKATRKWRFLSKMTPLRETLKILPLRFNIWDTDWRFFARISCQSVTLQRKQIHIVPLQKNTFRRHFAPLWPREIWVRRSYACKILSGYVKICRSYSRKVNFEQLHIAVTQMHDCVQRWTLYRVAQLKWGQLTFLMVTFEWI